MKCWVNYCLIWAQRCQGLKWLNAIGMMRLSGMVKPSSVNTLTVTAENTHHSFLLILSKFMTWKLFYRERSCEYDISKKLRWIIYLSTRNKLCGSQFLQILFPIFPASLVIHKAIFFYHNSVIHYFFNPWKGLKSVTIFSSLKPPNHWQSHKTFWSNFPCNS